MGKPLSDKNIVRLARYGIVKLFQPEPHGLSDEFMYVATHTSHMRYSVKGNDSLTFNTPVSIADIELKRFKIIGRKHKNGKRLNVLMDVGYYKNEMVFINRRTLIAEYKWT